MKSTYVRRADVLDAMQFDGENQVEMVEAFPFLVYDGELKYGSTIIAPTEWVAVQRSGETSVLIVADAVFVETFQESAPDGRVLGSSFGAEGRYKAKPITAVEAVTWDGENFGEVQGVCPQVARTEETAVLALEDGTEIYVGDVVMRYLDSGNCLSVKPEVFQVLYEVEGI